MNFMRVTTDGVNLIVGKTSRMSESLTSVSCWVFKGGFGHVDGKQKQQQRRTNFDDNTEVRRQHNIDISTITYMPSWILQMCQQASSTGNPTRAACITNWKKDL